MKAYVMTTGGAFGLLVLVHLWRAVEEGSRIVKDPFFIGVTAIAAILCLWALRVLRTIPR